MEEGLQGTNGMNQKQIEKNMKPYPSFLNSHVKIKMVCRLDEKARSDYMLPTRNTLAIRIWLRNHRRYRRKQSM